MDEQYFKLLMEDGTEQQCRVVITFDTDDKSYVLYALVDDEGNESEEISALRFELDENGEMTDFTPLESEQEWEMVDEVLNTLIGEFGDGEEDFFTISTEDNEEIVCEVLHRFDIAEFNRSYILYAYADQEELGEVFASAYVAGENGEVIDLLPIESDQEWNIVEKELESLGNKN